MQVDKIVLTLRYSKELVDGAWKSIEVGAEAVPSEDRNWQEQQRELYTELAGQLRLLFNPMLSEANVNDRSKPATEADPQP